MSGSEAAGARFSGEWTDQGDYAVLRFQILDGPVPDLEYHLGFLTDGKAMAGDGGAVGDRSDDFVVTFYDFEKIDYSTISTDYQVAVSVGTPAAFFLTWRDETSRRVFAGGVVVNRDETGFHIEWMLDDPYRALDFVRSTETVLQDRLDNGSTEPEADDAQFDEIAVAGYRGFSEPRALKFARYADLAGSGLTILVGANNSGKSTFLEALQIIARAKQQQDVTFSQPRRNQPNDFVSMTLSRDDGRALKVETIRKGGSQAARTWLPHDAAPTRFEVHITPSRRNFSPYFGNTGIAERGWGLMEQDISRTNLREQFVGRLRKVDRDPTARVVFDGLLEEIVGYRLDWSIDEIATGQQFLKMTEPEGAWHTSEGLGDGLVSLLFIVDALYDSAPGSLIAIDEPELSLHPQLIKRLRKVLSRFATDRQIVIATHSPLLIDWTDVANGATVARVHKKDGHSEVSQATRATLEAVAKLADTRNLKNPHTVGAVGREAFFLEDGVVLTEGQDDVSYLPRVLGDLGLPEVDNLYGWGSGGVGNIPLLAQLFVELGFTKIGAILDDDGNPGTIASLEKLQAMSPIVVVRQIPAPDIRHKDAVTESPEVRGLLDEGNKTVRTELREAAIEAITTVIDHVKRD